MLHSHPYNSGLTKELKDAFRERDTDYLVSEIRRLSLEVANLDFDHPDYDSTTSSLHIVLGLLDSLTCAGETVSFVTDFINL